MIKARIIRKIFVTTMTMFILLTVFSISMLGGKESVLPVITEVESVYSFNTNNIYLLNEKGYLVRGKILLDEDSLKDNILKILNNLTISDTSKFSNKLRGTIPKDVNVLDVICGSNLVTVNFSDEFLEVDETLGKQMIVSIVYSLLDLERVEGVSILVDGKVLDCYPNTEEKLPLVLDKSIGINKQYDINSRSDITSVVVYYLENIEEDMYYVPVTKYLNDDREKIKVIVEELTTSYIYEDNLMSFLNSKTELIDYKEENNIMFLNFNEYLFDGDDRVLEEVVYSISYSVFDNYEVSMVIFQVNAKDVCYVERNKKNEKNT